MDLSMPGELGDAYTSPTQKARVITEAWGARELFCANCVSDALVQLPNNEKAADYRCPNCKVRTQLKGKSSAFGHRVRDGSYQTFVDELRAGRQPDLMLVQYHRATWTAQTVLLVPAFALPESAVVRSKPTLPKGRSQHWVGCNLSLANVPLLARIPLVTDGFCRPPVEVRADYAKLRPLVTTPPETRGWTLDVLRVAQSFGAKEFTNADVYAHEPELGRFHPNNRHVADKIRQQLQVLRDLGLLVHVSPGRWRNVTPAGSATPPATTGTG